MAGEKQTIVQSMLNMGSKRERKPNFSDAEMHVIIEGISEHRTVMMNTSKDIVVVMQRRAVLKRITERVNEVIRTEMGEQKSRTLPEVKKKWHEMKSAALKIHNTKVNLSRGYGNRVKHNKIVLKENPFTQMVLDIVLPNRETDAGNKGQEAPLQLSPVDRGAEERREFRDTNSSELDSTSLSESTLCSNTNSFEMLPVKSEPRDVLQDCEMAVVAHVSKRSESPMNTLRMQRSVRYKRDRKQNFTNAEIKTLLQEINKHRHTLFAKEVDTSTNGEKHATWTQILDKCHKASGQRLRTVAEIHKKWQNLKLEAKKEQKRRETDKARGLQLLESTSDSPYTDTVLAILAGTLESPPQTSSSVDFQELRRQGKIGRQRQHSNTSATLNEECVFPKRNVRKSAALSEAECQCLVTEVERRKDVLLGRNDSADGLLRSQSCAWREVTEAVNRCDPKSFRWTARQIKRKWSGLCGRAKRHLVAVSKGIRGSAEPVFFPALIKLLQPDFDAALFLASLHTAEQSGGVQVCRDIANTAAAVLDPTVSFHTGGNSSHDVKMTKKNTSLSHSDGANSTAKKGRAINTNKREKSKNFSRRELEILLKIYERNKELLNSKKMDHVTVGKKHSVYQIMADTINRQADQFSIRRTVSQVRKKVSELRVSALRSWQEMQQGLQNGKPFRGNPEFVERVLNAVDLTGSAMNNFEVYQDIAVEDEDGRLEEDVSEEINGFSATVLQHISALAHICAELRLMGLEVGSVVFEDDNILTCGTPRLKHLAEHPTLPSIMAERQKSKDSASGKDITSEDWTVTPLHIPPQTPPPPPHSDTVKPSAPSAAAAAVAEMTSGLPDNVCSSGTDSEMNGDTVLQPVVDSWAPVSAENVFSTQRNTLAAQSSAGTLSSDVKRQVTSQGIISLPCLDARAAASTQGTVCSSVNTAGTVDRAIPPLYGDTSAAVEGMFSSVNNTPGTGTITVSPSAFDTSASASTDGRFSSNMTTAAVMQRQTMEIPGSAKSTPPSMLLFDGGVGEDVGEDGGPIGGESEEDRTAGFMAVCGSDRSAEMRNKETPGTMLCSLSDTDKTPSTQRVRDSPSPSKTHLPGSSATIYSKLSFTCQVCSGVFLQLATFLQHTYHHRQPTPGATGVSRAKVSVLSSECSREGEENSRGKRGETVGSASAFIGDIKREVPFVAEASAWADPGMRRMGEGRMRDMQYDGSTLKTPVVLLQKLPASVVQRASAPPRSASVKRPREKGRGTPAAMDFDDEDDGGGGGDGGDDITQYDVNMMMSESQQSGNLAKAPYTKQQLERWNKKLADDPRERPHECQHCGKCFLTSTHLRQHVYIHTGEKPFACDLCDCRFRQMECLNVHRRKHTGERPYACTICGNRFYGSSDLAGHKRRCHGAAFSRKTGCKVDRYKCDVCNRVFRSADRLLTHKRAHTGEKPFTCDLCGKTFADIKYLRNHKVRHQGLRPYQCDVCGDKFTSKGNMKVHMRYHTGEKPFKCEFCTEAFYVSTTLTLHRRKHTGERPYLCDLCGASFRQGSKLKVHRRSHTGEKPYTCDTCGQAFKEKEYLTIHKRKHSGVQPYTCSICGKHFQKGSHLTVHTRLHTGERPYTCDICGEKFSRSDVMKLHKKKHDTSQRAGSGKPSSSGRTTTLHPTPLRQGGQVRGADLATQDGSSGGTNLLALPLLPSHLAESGPGMGGSETGQLGEREDSHLSNSEELPEGVSLSSSVLVPTLIPPIMASHLAALHPGYQYQ